VRRSLPRLCAPLAAAILAAGAGASVSGRAAFPGRHLLLVTPAGAVRTEFPDIDGEPLAALADGRGGWLVGGMFRRVGSALAPSLVRLRRDGTLDARWNAHLRGGQTVTTLALAGSTLYAGGRFGVAAFDARTGRRLAGFAPPRFAAAPGTSTPVTQLAVAGGRVYVVGPFVRAGATARASAAALDARSGALTPWAPQVSGTAEAVAVAGGLVYLGGVFDAVDGAARSNVAAVGPARALVTGWAPRVAVDEVRSILVAGRRVLVGGNGFDAVDARTGRQLAWRAKVTGAVTVFAREGGTVYLGGDIRDGFTAVGGQARHNLAAVRLASGRVTSWAPDPFRYNASEALAVSSGTVLAAGSYTTTLG